MDIFEILESEVRMYSRTHNGTFSGHNPAFVSEESLPGLDIFGEAAESATGGRVAVKSNA